MPAINMIHRAVLIAMAGIIASASPVCADSPSALLAGQFSRIDSLIGSFENMTAAGVPDSARAQAALNDLLHQNTGLAALAYAGDNGKLLASASYDGVGNALGGKIPRAEWYRAARRSGKPWYGGMSQVNGHFVCFWSRPLYSGGTLGIKSNKGVIVAVVNVGECLKNFADVYRRPFELLYDGRLFFHSDDWRSGLPVEEEAFAIPGGVKFTVRYTNAPPPQRASADSLDTAAAGTAVPPVAAQEPAAAPTRTPINPPSAGAASPVWFYMVVSGVLGALAAAGMFLLLRRRGRRTAADTEVEMEVTHQEQAAARPAADTARYEEIRSRIEKSETAAIENEVRQRLRRELQDQLRKEGAAGLSDEVRREMLEQERSALREELRRQLIASEQTSLRDEARAAVLDEVVEKLRSEVGGQLEMEALQELTRTVKAEVRSENGKGIKARALQELEERIRQEVEIRERSMLAAQAREEIKRELADALRAGEAAARQAPAVPAVPETAAPPVPAAPAALPEGPAATIRGALRSIDESGALSSLAATVAMLKEAQHGSPCFNLNAAQTSSMIAYLDKIENRLSGHIGEIRGAVAQPPAGKADGGAAAAPSAAAEPAPAGEMAFALAEDRPASGAQEG